MSIPKRTGDWLDERTGWRTSLRAWMDHPIVGGAPWASAMAASSLACFVVLASSGIAMMTSYAPAPQSAWASVHYIQFVQSGGWLVRGLHYWAAQALIVLAALHIAHGALVSVHRKPREIAWWLTLLVLALTMGEAITGGLLPWDQKGWWARVVEGNIVSLAPGLGGWLQAMIFGGAELGAVGLARGYTAHVAILPALLLLSFWARAKLVRRHGWVEPERGAPTGKAAQEIARGTAVAGATVVFVLGLAAFAGRAPLDAPADPMSDYPARPEWFLMTLFEMRKLFHGIGELWGTTLPGLAAAAYLALLPWIDRPRRHVRGSAAAWSTPERSRLVVFVPVALIFGGALSLGLLAWRKDSHDTTYTKQRARADALAAAATRLAMGGVPPAGALVMVQQDPELRGAALFERHCASCHVLGDLGDSQKATATKLDGWTTADWIATMIHDPDAPGFFGRGPYATQMPSVDVRPKNKPPEQAWKPMVKDDAEKRAVAEFLAAQGNEADDPPRPLDPAALKVGETIVSERCSTCHLWKGDGDDEGSGLAPELSGYGSLAWTQAQVANPSSTKTYREKALGEELKKHMPRFDKDLSPSDVELVARWTRAHARGLPVR
jgi:ubiquinol-cytochrome c reductase cytochrome b subunit